MLWKARVLILTMHKIAFKLHCRSFSISVLVYMFSISPDCHNHSGWFRGINGFVVHRRKICSKVAYAACSVKITVITSWSWINIHFSKQSVITKSYLPSKTSVLFLFKVCTNSSDYFASSDINTELSSGLISH